MIIRDDRVVAAGALLPLAETSIHTERFGTRHRAALGITEQTDAVVVVVSEENGQISLVERARIVRNLNEAGLARAIQRPARPGRAAVAAPSAGVGGAVARSSGRSPRLRELGRLVGRPATPGETPPPSRPRASLAPVAAGAAPAPRPPAGGRADRAAADRRRAPSRRWTTSCRRRPPGRRGEADPAADRP